jgi:pSer/pThr/pTyr-binding forkhead associated (FHA) protein
LQEGGDWYITGKEGGNGTFLNLQRIAGKHRLRSGDSIGFGHGHDISVGESVDSVAMVYEFEFKIEEAPQYVIDVFLWLVGV